MMRYSVRLTLIKFQLACKTLGWLFRKPRYIILALVITFIFFEIVFWMFNMSVLWSLMTSGHLAFSEKLSVFISPFISLQGMSSGAVFLMMVMLALLQGISLSALIYAIRHQPKTDSALLGGSAITSILALIGLGCPACGTSLITPIVAVFASSSAVAISETLTLIALPLAISIAVYGTYVLGLRISTIKAHQQN